MLLSVFPADIVLNNRITIVLNEMEIDLENLLYQKKISWSLGGKVLKKTY